MISITLSMSIIYRSPSDPSGKHVMSFTTHINVRPWMAFLLLALALTTLANAHKTHELQAKRHAAGLKELIGGANLVLERYSGDVIVRAAREAEAVSSSDRLTTTPIAGGNKRVKHNRKSNKANNQTQRADLVGARKPGPKKSSIAAGGKEQLQRSQIKPQPMEQQQQQHRASKRSGAKAKASENGNGRSCRYAKSSWTECDAKTNMRTRTMTLKKGDSHCLPTRSIQKKCKKACRYEKGSWSECKAGEMTREDKIKISEDGSHQSCNQVRTITKKCNPGNAAKNSANGGRSSKVRKHKEKGTRHISAQA